MNDHAMYKNNLTLSEEQIHAIIEVLYLYTDPGTAEDIINHLRENLNGEVTELHDELQFQDFSDGSNVEK